MVSRENHVILTFGALALVLAYGTWAFTNVPDWVAVAVLIGVGVVIPQAVTDALDDR